MISIRIKVGQNPGTCKEFAASGKKWGPAGLKAATDLGLSAGKDLQNCPFRLPVDDTS
jgi:hypothetical protein